MGVQEISDAGRRSTAANMVLLRPAGNVPTIAANVLDDARRGEIVVIEKGLQAAGLYDEICTDTIDAIARAASPEKAALVADQGFERLHEILSAEEIFKSNEIVSRTLTAKAIPIVRRIVENVIGHTTGFYALDMAMTRFFTPHDFFAENEALFSQRLGNLKIQSPHRDSWFTHARNGINLWIAVGRVSRGNGMMVYPEMWDRPVEHRGIHAGRKQGYGRPMNFELGRGDILVFHGEHLHSSEINYTAETRYVLTSRFVLGPPVYGEGPRWIPHYYTPWLGGPLDFCTNWRSMLDPALGRYLFDKLCSRYAFTARFRNTAYDDA